ncbi:salivary glue protein Sgs-3-like [Amphibalanus amphitrite]|uniref:salivary glue protein Sgs-3-like n=1 Tax=Amphibalanus amphitrite TaxID=1232801 RepID=UPI001C8FE19C|nr:salivary glue protein Sgs-3-like [Amphibalanus amphitrite]
MDSRRGDGPLLLLLLPLLVVLLVPLPLPLLAQESTEACPDLLLKDQPVGILLLVNQSLNIADKCKEYQCIRNASTGKLQITINTCDTFLDRPLPERCRPDFSLRFPACCLRPKCRRRRRLRTVTPRLQPTGAATGRGTRRDSSPASANQTETKRSTSGAPEVTKATSDLASTGVTSTQKPPTTQRPQQSQLTSTLRPTPAQSTPKPTTASLTASQPTVPPTTSSTTERPPVLPSTSRSTESPVTTPPPTPAQRTPPVPRDNIILSTVRPRQTTTTRRPRVFDPGSLPFVGYLPPPIVFESALSTSPKSNRSRSVRTFVVQYATPRPLPSPASRGSARRGTRTFVVSVRPSMGRQVFPSARRRRRRVSRPLTATGRWLFQAMLTPFTN